MSCETEAYDENYLGFRIYFAGYNNGVCVDNAAGTRILTRSTPRKAKKHVKELVKRMGRQ